MIENTALICLGVIREKLKNRINDMFREKNLREINSSHGFLMLMLYKNNGRAQIKHLTEIMGKRKSTITYLVKKLEELEFIERKQSEDDQRILYIQFTKKAYEYKDIFDEIMNELRRICFENIKDEELENFCMVLKKVMRGLENSDYSSNCTKN